MVRKYQSLTVAAATLLVATALPNLAQAQYYGNTSPNARIAAAFGTLEGKGLVIANANFVQGMASGFTTQFDVNAGGTTEYGFIGGTARMGFRQADNGYFGLVGSASHINRDNGQYGYLGAEAQMHFGNFSVDGLIGYELWDDNDGEIMGAVTASMYITDNMRLYAGYRYIADNNTYAAGMEFRPNAYSDRGMTLFADARFQDTDDVSIMGGVRFSFNGQRTLKQENRNDFVNNNLFIDELLPR
ncbi:hypothetical protein E1162_17615 [Rhodobacteraceae bacterium RKSG542]|uniref:hypothetical protein n=1 Tax=Pseudovibrio flavus TaxID=2529854 RepID=UPI0012BBD903|nr:hypothetical protein [Pseudovibrio flavus]MTI19064.1 hypothetical protein [Pseudovibrio flavus]